LAELNNILSTFEPTNLEELEKVKLLNRTDIKFTFAFDQLSGILKQILPHYKCLQLASGRISTYQTLYYDTNDLLMYKKHHNGSLNRQKVRHRIYTDSDLSFLEVKHKNNKNRTIKERIKSVQTDSEFEANEMAFLNKELGFDPKLLRPMVWVDYQRITFSSKTGNERLTIDINLKFRKPDSEIELNNLVIAEVKQEGKGHSAFVKLMKDQQIRQNSISKYCFAIAATDKDVKQNNFKERFSSLKNILDHDTFAKLR